MVIRGKIFDIINVNDKVTQVVIMVKKDEKYHPICLCAYGDVKSLICQIKLLKNDFVKITYFVRSKKFEDKYYTTAVIEKIVIIEKSSPQILIDLMSL